MHDVRQLGYRIEQAAFDAWPSARTIVHDGWTIRLSSGYTGRANSVTPMGPARPPFEEQVAFCEALFGEMGLPPLFRLTALEDYSELDAFLASRGYTRTDGAIVMTASCLSGSPTGLRALSIDEWLPWYDQFSARGNTAGHRAILERIAAPHVLAGFEVSGEMVGVGLAVVGRGLVGLFDIVISPAQRGKGLGKTLVREMLAWGCQRGAETAYLQVADGNHAARRLYESLGFTELYRYRYRRKAVEPA